MPRFSDSDLSMCLTGTCLSPCLGMCLSTCLGTFLSMCPRTGTPTLIVYFLVLLLLPQTDRQAAVSPEFLRPRGTALHPGLPPHLLLLNGCFCLVGHPLLTPQTLPQVGYPHCHVVPICRAEVGAGEHSQVNTPGRHVLLLLLLVSQVRHGVPLPGLVCAHGADSVCITGGRGGGGPCGGALPGI